MSLFLVAQLQFIYLAVGARHCHEFGVCSLLDDAALIKNKNLVCAEHARKPLRHDDRRAPFHHTVKRLLD